MIEAVARRGADGLNGVELCRMAGVSKHTLYDHYKDGVLGCLRATCEMVLAGTARDLSAAVRRGAGWQDRLCLVLETIGRVIAANPKGARLVLLDAFDAPAGVLEVLVDGAERLEEQIADCFFDAPAGQDPPPLVVKGIVLGAAHVARAHLLTGHEHELPACAPALAAWACACCTAAAETQPRHDYRADVQAAPGAAIIEAMAAAVEQGAARERLWLLGACVRLAGEHGRDSLMASRITAAAGLPRGAFREHFEDPGQCLIAAYRLICNAAMTRALAAGGAGERRDSIAAVRRILAELARQFAADSMLARVAFYEILAEGARGVATQTELLEDTVSMLPAYARRRQLRNGTDSIATSAAAGAIWGLVGHLCVSGRAGRLPANTGVLTRLALAAAASDQGVGTRRLPGTSLGV